MEIVNTIDTIHRDIGIKSFRKDWSDIDMILNLSRKEIESLSPKEASAFAVVLCQYSFFVQIRSNKIDAVIAWCNNQLKISRQEQKTKLFKTLESAHAQKTALMFLARRIELLADTFKNISRYTKE